MGGEKLHTLHQKILRAGITPAWAGKSGCMMPAFAVSGDHPRVGGEKPASRPSKRPVWGSPPRGRGKGPAGQRPLLDTRITPAWAGKSAQLERPPPLTQDHPRVGGEKTKKIP